MAERTMSRTPRDTDVLGRIFRISLILKGLDGVMETIGGVALLLISPGQINGFLRLITTHELSEDPGDFVANALRSLGGTMTVSAAVFAAAYLIVHGVVKVALVWAVITGKHWAYPWMVAFLVVFIVYQGYTLLGAFTWGMLALTVFDLLVLWLTIREYKQVKNRGSETRPGG